MSMFVQQRVKVDVLPAMPPAIAIWGCSAVILPLRVTSESEIPPIWKLPVPYTPPTYVASELDPLLYHVPAISPKIVTCNALHP